MSSYLSIYARPLNVQYSDRVKNYVKNYGCPQPEDDKDNYSPSVVDKENVDIYNEMYENSLQLLCYPTSLTRDLYDEIPYTGGEIRKFSLKMCKEVIEKYEDDITNWEKLIEKNKQEIQILEERITKITDKSIYDSIDEEISDLRNSIKSITNEELVDAKRCLGDFCFILAMMSDCNTKDSKKPFVFEYTMD